LRWRRAFIMRFIILLSLGQISIMNAGFITRTLIGKVRISLVEVAGAGPDGLKRWCTLMNEDLEVFRDSRGEIEVNVSWVYDPEATTKSGFLSWATSSKRKKKVGKLEQEVSQLLSQTESEEVLIRRQRRTKEEQDRYELARWVIV